MNTGAAHEEIQQHHHRQSPTALAPNPTPATPHLHGLAEADPARCLAEAADFLAGKPHTFMPDCICLAIGSFGKAWAHTHGDPLHHLRPLIPLMLGTGGRQCSRALLSARCFLALDWIVRVNLPTWLEFKTSLREDASRLRDLPEITNPSSLLQIRGLIDEIMVKTRPLVRAARNKPCSAARLAAHERETLALSSLFAAWEAIEHLGKDYWKIIRLHRAALQSIVHNLASIGTQEAVTNTQTFLQASALELLQRMIALQDPTPATDAPAGVGSPTPPAPAPAPDRKAWAISLLTALREARPTSEYYRTGYRHAVSVICAHIEQSEYFLGGETAKDLAATRQAFNIRA